MSLGRFWAIGTLLIVPVKKLPAIFQKIQVNLCLKNDTLLMVQKTSDILWQVCTWSGPNFHCLESNCKHSVQSVIHTKDLGYRMIKCTELSCRLKV